MAHSIASPFLVHAPGAELFPLSNDPWMTDALVKKFEPETLRSYKTSLAAPDLIPRKFLRVLDEVTFPAAVLALLIVGVCAFRRRLAEALSLGIFVAAAVVINNVLCASGSGVHDRYPARVTWLVAFSALSIFASLCRQTETSGVVASRVNDATSPAVGTPGGLEKPQMN